MFATAILDRLPHLSTTVSVRVHSIRVHSIGPREKHKAGIIHDSAREAEEARTEQ
jgi:hypothetical protein